MNGWNAEIRPIEKVNCIRFAPLSRTLRRYIRIIVVSFNEVS